MARLCAWGLFLHITIYTLNVSYPHLFQTQPHPQPAWSDAGLKENVGWGVSLTRVSAP